MKFTVTVISVIILFLLNLFIGSVNLPASDVLAILTGNGGGGTAEFIVLGSRLPMAVTATLAGAGLAASGLMLQTAFRNPLAGPSILGISSGASLGVAVVMLLFGGTVSAGVFTLGGYTAVVAGAFAGSLLIMGILLSLSSILKNDLMLLITGIMIGYLVSSAIMLLNYAASAEGIQGYVMWGMSTFNSVAMDKLPLFGGLVATGLIIALTLVKPLNLLLLGDGYARNLGINIRRVRNLLLLATGLLTATITAFCGPVSFLGLAVPHIARLIFRSDNHRTLLPATLLTGAGVTLCCNLVCVLPSDSVLPVNAVTPLFGAPVVLWILLRNRRKG
ncbi:MAG: iron ABC transporter permease [Duncaniella sp.]|uniref:iron ABC transporter permease n=1 Tax=Duncaniella sp. TaxID=2518496 RepID=UPI0019A8E210|nr:iron ABC transporter permease [Duncaniella sp.]MBD5314137.1 iron ABC transporter permease [Bacteroides sp.]MDE6091131.1 iron ABC transporter permease [Duncaniella sp.]